MILLIDNYDSFTFNLVHFLGDLGARCEVRRNDRLSVAEALAMAPEAIVLSPGPCTPNEAGICLDLIAAAAGRIPMLGVCLGHQAIGQAFGGEVVRAPAPMHGKVSPILHDGTDIFAGVPSPFAATRYHSLVVRAKRLPPVLMETARTADGLIMGAAPPRPCRCSGCSSTRRASPASTATACSAISSASRAAATLRLGPRRLSRRHDRQPQADAGPPGRRRNPDGRRTPRRLRRHHVGRGDAGADRRPAHGHAGARRDGGGDHRRGARHARADGARSRRRRTRSTSAAPAATAPAR